MKEKNLIQILSQSHSIEILKSLSQRQMRFVDLKEVCNSNRTRAARLKDLQDKGLIKVVPKILGKRAYTFYEITSRGREALKLSEKLILLEKTEQRKNR
ncbi:MAG: winged helix-turn-helix transcriptional regulator [Candidatus Bathyarchaeia archaeon]